MEVDKLGGIGRYSFERRRDRLVGGLCGGVGAVFGRGELVMVAMGRRW